MASSGLGFALDGKLAHHVGLDVISVRSLAGLGENAAACDGDRAFAGFLPTVGHPSAVAFASCLFSPEIPIGSWPPSIYRYTQGTCTPQVHAHAGRTVLVGLGNTSAHPTSRPRYGPV